MAITRRKRVAHGEEETNNNHPRVAHRKRVRRKRSRYPCGRGNPSSCCWIIIVTVVSGVAILVRIIGKNAQIVEVTSHHHHHHHHHTRATTGRAHGSVLPREGSSLGQEILYNYQPSLREVTKPLRNLSLQQQSKEPDFGGIEFQPLPSSSKGHRSVNEQADFEYWRNVPRRLRGMDYYLRGQDEEQPLVDNPFDPEDPCIESRYEWDQHPNCNFLHETSMEHMHFLGHGEFRQVWRVVDPSTMRELIVKTYIMEPDDEDGVDPAGLRDVARDANIMEKLTASPLIVDVYGHCALTLVVEKLDEVTDKIVSIPEEHTSQRGRITKTALDEYQANGELHCFNNFTAEEKLDLSLEMAEGLAVVHGYSGGFISHGDVWIDQWMLRDGKAILTDFNVGSFLQWSEEDNEYCDFDTTESGSYTAPEELTGGTSLLGAVDVFSFGLVIYSVITGLYPMYDVGYDLEEEHRRFIDGEMPFVDPRYRERSYIEDRLVEIMLKCLLYEPADRISIFGVVDFLRETKLIYQAKSRKALRASHS